MKKQTFKTNEIVIELIPSKYNNNIPHKLVYKQKIEGVSKFFGIKEIDEILSRLNVLFIGKSFLPKNNNSNGINISRDYDKEEIQLGFANRYIVRFGRNINILGICEKLNALTMIKSTTPNYTAVTFRKGEPYSPNEKARYIREGLWFLKRSRIDEAQNIERGNPNISIAIIDTGLNMNDPLFEGRIVSPMDLVDTEIGLGDPFRFQGVGDYQNPDYHPDDISGHGTAVSSLALGASASNGFIGAAPDCSIMPIRAMYMIRDVVSGASYDRSDSENVNSAIYYAVNNGARVVNLSLGGYSENQYGTVLQYAKDKNVAVVAASGNDYSSAKSYPASDPNVLAVGAIQYGKGKKMIWSNSNYGNNYNKFVVAPGVGVLVKYHKGEFLHSKGTSLATPLVAGIMGLAISYAERLGHILNVDDLYEIIQTTAVLPDSKSKGDKRLGYGVVDAVKVIKAIERKYSNSYNS